VQYRNVKAAKVLANGGDRKPETTKHHVFPTASFSCYNTHVCPLKLNHVAGDLLITAGWEGGSMVP
jgi:hypothetical protein